MSGRLVGIGVGPGDPELLTLKAARLIAACPVTAYIAAEDRASLARTIGRRWKPSSHVYRRWCSVATARR